MNGDLATNLTRIGLRATAEHLDDFIARATTKRLAPRAMLEQIVEAEMADRATRNLQRLLKQARIGRFKPISDFDWDWPKKIDRELVERALTLDFISEARNLILLGANGLGCRSPYNLPNVVTYFSKIVLVVQNWKLWHSSVGDWELGLVRLISKELPIIPKPFLVVFHSE
jgi:hypothetical protein